MAVRRFNPPPGWPRPPTGWVPPPGWRPDPSWPPPPPGWQVWVDLPAHEHLGGRGPRLPGARGRLLPWAAAVAVVCVLAVALVSLLRGGPTGSGAGADDRSAAAASRPSASPSSSSSATPGSALGLVAALEVKGRAPRTGYDRAVFGPAWADTDRNGCDTRNDVLARDLSEVQHRPGTRGCVVESGVLADPFSGRTVSFVRGEGTSELVQVDHVVALSDAWQKGAQQWEPGKRLAFANDPLNLLAVDGPLNQQKGDGDTATWLPPHRPSWCGYVARQVAVKVKYGAWVTAAERDAMLRVLQGCPGEVPPSSDAPTVAPVAPPAPPRADPSPSAAAPAPAGSSPPEERGCDPAYPDVCIPPLAQAGDLDCGDIEHRRFAVLPADPHRFDGNDDGVGCEG